MLIVPGLGSTRGNHADIAQALSAVGIAALALDPDAPRADGVARGYWHATGDDQVPWGSTFALAGAAPHPKRLRIALGGAHGSLQHDPAILAETVAFLAEHLARP